MRGVYNLDKRQVFCVISNRGIFFFNSGAGNQLPGTHNGQAFLGYCGRCFANAAAVATGHHQASQDKEMSIFHTLILLMGEDKQD